MEEYLDLREMWRAGKSISEIARLTGRDRKTVRRLVQGKAPEPRAPRLVGSKLDPFRDYLLQRLLHDKVSNAAVLFDEIRTRGYTGGRSILWEFLHPLRSLLEERTTVRFETPPGKQAQADWGTFRKPARTRVQAFVMTLGWSRASFLDFSDTQALPALLRCHEHAFHYLGGIPEEILYDRMKTVWLKDDHHGDPLFHPGLLDFAQHYGFRPRLCRARRPQTKGKVENGVGYVGKNFWPRVDDYVSAADLVPQARRWLDETANVRVHGTTGERPVDRLSREPLRPVTGIPPYRALILERRRVATWSTPVVVEPPASRPDKPLMAVDTTSGAPYSHPGRLYLAYDNQVSASSQPIVVNRSDNGASWLSTGQAAYDEGGGIGAYPAVGSSGELYVLSNDFCGGLVNGACQRPAGQILISKSIDGGQTFGALPNTPQLVATTTIGSGAALTNWGNGCAGEHKVRSSPALAVDTSGGPMTGAVYVVWNDEQPSGAKMHIFFSRSLDGGATWKTAQGTTIQQIDTGNANDAWQPALAVDQSNGVVSISWYDRRDDPNNKLYKVYYSQSADGGGSFTAPIAVSTAQSDPTLTCSATGDYMSVVSVDGIAHPFWTDNRSNINQIWTAPITESVIGGGCQTIPVAAGWASSYALTKQGNVWAWGNNGSGQLGQGSPGPSGSSTPIEVVAPAGQSGYLSGIRSISAGQYFALALKSADGSVWGWGQGGDGELGQGGTNRSDSPTPVQVTAPSGSGYLLGVIAISAGDNFSVALRGDGTVWTWGNNVYGQLGNPTDYGSTIAVVTTPVEVVGPSGTGNLTNIVAISAGSTHVLALDASNQVWAWGSDGWGALGNSPPTPGYAPILTTAPAGQQGNLTASAVVPGENGGEHSLAMESTGIVYAWGENDHGQLGLGTTDTNIHQTPAQVLGSAKNTFLTGVGAIGAGGYHSLAVKSANGAVVTWGYNMYGQLGNGNSGSRADSNKPVSVLGPGGSGSLTGMMLAIGGTWHSLAEASSGTSLWAWGYNLDGELGNGGTANSSFPVQVSGLTGITTPLLCA